MSLRAHFEGRIVKVELKEGVGKTGRDWRMLLVNCITNNEKGDDEYFKLTLFSPTYDAYFSAMKQGIVVSGTSEISVNAYLDKKTGTAKGNINFDNIKFTLPVPLPFERKVEKVGGSDVPF